MESSSWRTTLRRKSSSPACRRWTKSAEKRSSVRSESTTGSGGTIAPGKCSHSCFRSHTKSRYRRRTKCEPPDGPPSVVILKLMKASLSRDFEPCRSGSVTLTRSDVGFDGSMIEPIIGASSIMGGSGEEEAVGDGSRLRRGGLRRLRAAQFRARGVAVGQRRRVAALLRLAHRFGVSVHLLQPNCAELSSRQNARSHRAHGVYHERRRNRRRPSTRCHPLQATPRCPPPPSGTCTSSSSSTTRRPCPTTRSTSSSSPSSRSTAARPSPSRCAASTTAALPSACGSCRRGRACGGTRRAPTGRRSPTGAAACASPPRRRPARARCACTTTAARSCTPTAARTSRSARRRTRGSTRATRRSATRSRRCATGRSTSCG